MRHGDGLPVKGRQLEGPHNLPDAQGPFGGERGPGSLQSFEGAGPREQEDVGNRKGNH